MILSKRCRSAFVALVLGTVAIALFGCAAVARSSGKTFVIRAEVRTASGALADHALPVRVRGSYFDLRNLFWPILSSREIAIAITDNQGRFAVEVPYYSAYKVDVGSWDERYYGFANFQTADYSNGRSLIIQIRDAAQENARTEPTIQLSGTK